MNARHHISALAVLAAISMLVAACGGDSKASAPAKSTGATAVKISDFKFAPATLTVKHGASVTVTNDDSAPHTATADDGHSFDTGTLDPGSSKTITVAKPGTYAYHCSIHPFMHGRLDVK